MRLDTLLGELRRRRIEFWAVGKEIHFRPAERMSPDLAAAMAAWRSELLWVDRARLRRRPGESRETAEVERPPYQVWFPDWPTWLDFQILIWKGVQEGKGG